MLVAGWIGGGIFTRGAPFWGFSHLMNANLTITGGSTGRGIFFTVLPDRLEFADTVERGWFSPWELGGSLDLVC